MTAGQGQASDIDQRFAEAERKRIDMLKLDAVAKLSTPWCLHDLRMAAEEIAGKKAKEDTNDARRAPRAGPPSFGNSQFLLPLRLLSRGLPNLRPARRCLLLRIRG